MENCKELSSCLCCEGKDLRTILDLGNQSPVNNYEITQKFPVKLNVCMQCSHAQLSHAVNPKILFNNYPYMSGVSKTMLKFYKDFAYEIHCNYTDYKPGKTVMDIACNDGSQLDEFKKRGFKTFGIEPDKNLASLASKKHKIINAFFPTPITGKYDIIVAQNVVAHVDNPFQFIMGCKEIMSADSILCVQTSQAHMIKNHQFDTLYSEHISLFNKRSASKLFNRCDLEIVDYRFLNGIHGGSHLWILKKMPEITINDYSDFSNRCYKFAKGFKNTVDKLQRHHFIVCYGAAAKMINLIRFTGINPNYIIDETPLKIGKYVDGRLINDIDFLEKMDKGTVIIPVWNFAKEIQEKVEKLYPKKFRFLHYTPTIILE